MRSPGKQSVALLAALALSACVGSHSGDAAPPPVSRPAASPLVSDSPVLVGEPYSIGGNRYVPVDSQDYDEVGYASWYGAELEGRPTANGETFRSTSVSAAHRTLPLPSYVEVTRLDTGRTILVRINDRGPAVAGRLIDLSTAAAEELGISGMGAVPVRVRRTFPDDAERVALRSGQMVPPRADTAESLLEILRQNAARLPRPPGQVASSVPPRSAPSSAAPSTPAPSLATGAAPTAAAPAGSGALVVQVAAFSNRDRAEALARRIGATVSSAGAIFRVRYGPFATEAEAAAAVARARSLGQPGAVIQRAP